MRILKLLTIGIVLIGLTGCANLDQESSSSGGSSSFLITWDYLFTITTDYSSGNIAAVNPLSLTADTNLGNIHSDAVARFYNGEIYVVNRLGQDNILVLDKRTFEVKRQFSVGNNSNPHDIAFVSTNKAYVSRNNENTLLIVNPGTGDTLGTIDLSSLADSDGLCEMSQMVLLNNKLYVAVQRLDQDNWFTPVGPSYIAVIDVTTDALLSTITLSGTNPYTITYNADLDRILVACVGNWGVADAGIELVNPNNDTAEGVLISDISLGGDCSIFKVYSATQAYAVITDSGWNTSLISFNPTTGLLINSQVYAPGGFVLDGLELDNSGKLYVSDRNSSDPGVRVFNAATETQITTSPIDVGLPPSYLLFINN